MYAVEFRDVTYTYPGASRAAVKNIDLTIEKGEVVAIVGPTGAGKSTLAYLLNGTIPHFIEGGKLEGDVIVMGMNTKEHPIRILARKVALVFDDPNIQNFGLTVYESVAFGPANLGLPPSEIFKRTGYALKACRLIGYENRNPRNLSGGEQQSVAIAGALSMLPDILVLDEATAMLDPLGRQRVYSTVQDLNKEYDITVIIMGQDIEELSAIASRFIVLNDGRILLEGAPSEVLQNYEKLKEIGLFTPPVTEVAHRLKLDGLWHEKLPVTVEEFVSYVKKCVASAEATNFIERRYVELERSCSTEKTPVVLLKDVSYVYPATQSHALKDINLKVFPGEFISIIGQNGSGKTTLAKVIAGILKPTSGTVLIDNIDTKNKTLAELSRMVGYVFQDPDAMLFTGDIEEELSFGPRNIGVPREELKRRVEQAMRLLNLEKWRGMPIYSLPRGVRKRVAIASVLTLQPKVLIVDEPTTGQDWNESINIVETLKKINSSGITVMMITHEMELAARYSTRVVVMCGGKVLLDATPREVFSKPHVLAETYLQPPQIARAFQKLASCHLPEDVLLPEEAYCILKKVIGGGA
jgi:energy-coupling factor transport system ATP-binding protein